MPSIQLAEIKHRAVDIQPRNYKSGKPGHERLGVEASVIQVHNDNLDAEKHDEHAPYYKQLGFLRVFAVLDSHDARDKLTYAAYKRCKQSQKVIARKPGGSANSGCKRAEARDYNAEQ